jgi:primosomal protein N' (replication factor Y)
VITQLFPKIKIARFDRAVIKTHQKLNEVLEQFHRHETDLLIGTQMLSKGHNFEKVNLVVILGIDHQLQFPDFRSHERGLQLLMQVSGRSGRFGKQGTVLVQTQNPKLAVFDFLIHNDYLSFARSEMKVRKQCGFPPFAKLCSLAFSAKNENKLIEFCDKASQVLNELRQKHFPSVSVLGPKPAVIEKRVNNFTWVFLLKDQNVNQLHNLLKSFRSNIVMPSSISFKWDIDPQVLP